MIIKIENETLSAEIHTRDNASLEDCVDAFVNALRLEGYADETISKALSEKAEEMCIEK